MKREEDLPSVAGGPGLAAARRQRVAVTADLVPLPLTTHIVAHTICLSVAVATDAKLMGTRMATVSMSTLRAVGIIDTVLHPTVSATADRPVPVVRTALGARSYAPYSGHH